MGQGLRVGQGWEEQAPECCGWKAEAGVRRPASVLRVRVGVSGAELGYRCGWLCASVSGGSLWCVCVQVLCVSA